MLEVLVFIVVTGMLPVLVNKSTEDGRFDWLKGYLRESWTVLFVFFFLYLLSKPKALGVAMELRKQLPGPWGYVVFGCVGAALMCGYWWFAGKVFVSSPIVPGLKLRIDRLIPLWNFKHLQAPPGMPISIPQGNTPTSKDVDTYIIVLGTIVNDRAVQATAGYWEISAQLADGRSMDIELLVPAYDFAISHPHGPPDLIHVQDYWPRKLDMHSIPAYGLSYGFVFGVLRGVTPADFDKPHTSVTLCFQDSSGQRICDKVRQEDRPVTTMQQP